MVAIRARRAGTAAPVRAVTLLGCGVAAAGVALLARFDPAAGGYPPCVFHLLTGLHCPGCGSLRALHRLLHGDVAGAAGQNALAVLLLPGVLWWAARRAATGLGLPPLPAVGVTARWIWLLLALVLAFAVARNIPAPPFNWLAPG